MFLLRAVLNILVRNASPRGTMCFRCLTFSLSGPCELLFLFYCLLDLINGECDVVSLYVLCCSVNGSVCFVCACLTVFVICLVKQFAICLGVDAILLLNVMDVFSVLCWITRINFGIGVPQLLHQYIDAPVPHLHVHYTAA